ncbi:MAG TPA: hypothetical protein VFO83_13800, partial [Aggregicoccus sp.]|nr:hypothetical protein [Aggregicoccus sp.]
MGLQFDETVFAPGAFVARHSHERPLFAAVLQGSAELGLRRAVHGCRQGGVYTHAGELHENRFGARGARMLRVYLDRELELPPVVHAAQVSHVARQLAAELRATDSAAPLARE